MDRKGFQVWLEAYARAWMRRDPGAAAKLYAENATYQETPFSPPLRGREAILSYWKNVARTQEDIHVECRIMAVAGEECVAHWHASFLRLPMRIRLELDGIFLLTFDAENRCTSLREWWHRKEVPAGRS
jgi:SnoaL-like domain